MAKWGANTELPVTDQLACTNFAIPMSPVLTAKQALEVTDAITAAAVSGPVGRPARSTTAAQSKT
jgi:dTDP-4-amino-4,6-dideoxygalactose transaminase